MRVSWHITSQYRCDACEAEAVTEDWELPDGWGNAQARVSPAYPGVPIIEIDVCPGCLPAMPALLARRVEAALTAAGGAS